MIPVVRVVIVTSAIVAGLRSRLGAGNRLLTAVAQRRVRPLVTTAVSLAALASAAEPVEISFRWRPQLRDPKELPER